MNTVYINTLFISAPSRSCERIVWVSTPARTPLPRPVAGFLRFFALRRAPETIAPSLRAGITSSVTIAVSCLIFGPQLGAIALFGSMLALWEADRPLWARARNVLLIASTMSVSMILGVLVAPYRWAVVPAIVLIILVATLAYYAFLLTRGPGPLHLFYAATLGTYFGLNPELGWRIVGVTAFAAFFTGALTLLTLLVHPHRPEQRVVQDAHDAVEAYRAATQTGTDPDHGRSRRNAAYGAVNRAWLTVNSARPATHGRSHRARERELLAVNRLLAATVLHGLGQPDQVRELTPDTPLLLGRPSFRFLLAHALRGDSVAWFTAWRMGLAAGIAGLVTELAGIGHPYWAILTSTIILHQWVNRIATTRRAAHRAVGTLLGLGIVALVVTLNPGPWPVVAIVIACAIGQDVLIPLNYALALIVVTPMSLLSIEATGQGGPLTGLLSDRLLATLIGAAAAVLVTWATSYWFPGRLLRAQFARATAAITAVETVNAHGDAFSPAGRQARVELQYELIHHLTVLDRATTDDPRLATRQEAGHALADDGYIALAKTWRTEE